MFDFVDCGIADLPFEEKWYPGITEDDDEFSHEFYVREYSDGYFQLGIAHSAVGLVGWEDPLFTNYEDIEEHLYGLGFVSVLWSESETLVKNWSTV